MQGDEDVPSSGYPRGRSNMPITKYTEERREEVLSGGSGGGCREQTLSGNIRIGGSYGNTSSIGGGYVNTESGGHYHNTGATATTGLVVATATQESAAISSSPGLAMATTTPGAPAR